MTQRSLARLGYDTVAIEAEIHRVESRVAKLHGQALGRVERRKRPRFNETPSHLSGRKIYDIYFDESGIRFPNPQAGFGLFVVGAVAMETGYYHQVVKPAAQELKERYFGRPDVIFHEPGLRSHQSGFSFENDRSRQREFCAAYREFLSGLEIDCVAAVLDKQRLYSTYGASMAVDDFLPRNFYAMAYDFALERVCNLLYYERHDGIGAIYPERCGKREDAELQLEHARLVTQGTRYVQASWFQHQFRPGLRFYRKGQEFGTELADVVARTVADHYREGDEAACWNEICPKLFCGHMDKVDPGERWGRYKVFPAAT
jgi:hypothetical protein